MRSLYPQSKLNRQSLVKMADEIEQDSDKNVLVIS